MKDDAREVLVNTINNFRDFVERGNLDSLLGRETPYYKELFVENYEPGTFTIYDRKSNPDFLSKFERSFFRWLRCVVQNELVALFKAGELDTPVSDDLIIEATDQVNRIVDFRLKDGRQVGELVYNQEYCDVFHRIILWLMFGDPEKKVHVFKEFNELGLTVAGNILLRNPDKEMVDLMKWSIASGAIGIDLKGEDAAASRLASSGIELAMNKDESLQSKIRFVKRKLDEISTKGFSIDFWTEFENEVIMARRNLKVAWFTDDYIETLFDLKFIEKMLTKNDNLFVHLVPRAGRFVNDASYEDIMQFLRFPFLDALENLRKARRFRVSTAGPKASCVNGKKISDEAAQIIRESDAILFKGARTFEMLQGLRRTAYFAFVVCREFSEAVTCLDARYLPLVLIRQSAGERSFLGFRYRNRRTHTFRDGKRINVALKTALEYEKAKHICSQSQER